MVETFYDWQKRRLVKVEKLGPDDVPGKKPQIPMSGLSSFASIHQRHIEKKSKANRNGKFKPNRGKAGK